MSVTLYAETSCFIKRIPFLSQIQKRIQRFRAAGLLEICRKIESPEKKGNQLVTMLMLQTKCQRNKLYIHKRCNHSCEILVPEGTLEIWLLPCLKNSKFRAKKPSRMQLIRSLLGRLLLLPFALYDQITIFIFIIKMVKR